MGWERSHQALWQVRTAKDDTKGFDVDCHFLYRIAPASKGIGYGMLIISFLTMIYYNVIIAWTLFYSVAGLSAELPWQYCGNTTLTR